jgi:hypothetical protein
VSPIVLISFRVNSIWRNLRSKHVYLGLSRDCGGADWQVGDVLSLAGASLSKFESKIKEWKSAPWGHAESVAESFRKRIKPGLLVNAAGEIVLN